MKKDVTITLKGVQQVDRERSETELITGATFSTVKGGGFKIAYDETEATGFEGARTEITAFGNESASIVRSGEAGTNLIIEKDKKHYCHYGTPYGDMTIGIYTQSIVNNLTADGGDLYLKYTVDINSSYVSDNEVYIEIMTNS